MTANAVIVTGAIPVLVAEGKLVSPIADEDFAPLLTDDRLLKTCGRPPCTGNIGLRGERLRDVGHSARESALIDSAVADLLATVNSEREIVRPVDDIGLDRERLADFELLGRPRSLDGDRRGNLGAARGDGGNLGGNRGVHCEGGGSGTADNSCCDSDRCENSLHVWVLPNMRKPITRVRGYRVEGSQFLDFLYAFLRERLGSRAQQTPKKPSMIPKVYMGGVLS